jgi:hypothetical protein
VKILKILGSLAAIAAGIWLLLLFLETSVFSENLFKLYTGRLDKWVSDGASTSEMQSDVVFNCGGIVTSQAGFFRYLVLSTFRRAEFNFEVYVCSKMAVNRVYKHPEFDSHKLIRLICVGSNPLFMRLCSLWLPNAATQQLL